MSKFCDRAIHASDGFISTRARALAKIVARVNSGSIKWTEVRILSQKENQVSCVDRKLSTDAEFGWTRLFVFSHCGIPHIHTAAHDASRRRSTTSPINHSILLVA
jgi:hypothetical protein